MLLFVLAIQYMSIYSYIILASQYIKQVIVGHRFGHQSGQDESSEQHSTPILFFQTYA